MLRVYWPGQTRDMCVACAERAQAIAEAMSFELTIEPLGPRAAAVPE